MQAPTKTRIEVITPPWVKDPSKWPFGKLILPAESTPVKRLLIDEKTLSKQLRCSTHLVRELLKCRAVHHASSGEESAGLGLCAEDLAALGLGGMLCGRYNMKLNGVALSIIGDLRDELLNAPRPLRVILGVLRANKKTEVHIGTCRGPLRVFDVPSELRDAADYYDASTLRERIDEVMEEFPLNLPEPQICMVTKEDEDG